ncbi:U-scoloptoxin(11)-Ssd3a-like [Ornithodoros turicata]|uniref:U-scoloptoxin(11)-Ssd3a-like n=1 Tax=Ornithodoros turicata TaxID=34597 RepID=UPI003139F7D8
MVRRPNAFWLFAVFLGQAVAQELPECLPRSVCGYVQLNLAGVNAEPLCRCRAGNECPLVWDPLDGRTVSHGNDQYKYCERAPRLSTCTTEEVVYSSRSFITTSGSMANVVRIHCLCPPTHIFARNHTKFHQSDDGITSMVVTSLCKPPPMCNPVGTDACMAISESYVTGTKLLKRDCACPVGYYCPGDIRLAAERVEMPKGAYYLINCA